MQAPPMQAPTKLAPVSGWKQATTDSPHGLLCAQQLSGHGVADQAENKKPAGSQAPLKNPCGISSSLEFQPSLTGP